MDNLYVRELKLNDLERIKKVYEDEYEHGLISAEKYKVWKDTTPDLFKNYLEDMEKRKIGQGEEDIFGVNFYNYYLIENDEIIGTSSIRTNIENNENTKNLFGHIGYTIIPSKWKQGYGTKILHLLLEKCEQLGLDEVELICSKDNIGSQRVIENNFGKYIDTNFDSSDNEYYKRYIINVKESLHKFECKKTK